MAEIIKRKKSTTFYIWRDEKPHPWAKRVPITTKRK
jgi:hypothetical protein